VGNGRDFVAQHAAEDFAHARPGWHQGQGVGIGLFRGFHARARASREPVSLRGEQGHVDREGLWHGRVGKALSAALAVGLGGEVLAALGQVRLALGMWHLG
jgi:hypothetical protein